MEDDPLIQYLVADLLNWYLGERRLPKFHKDVASRWRLHLQAHFANIESSKLSTAHLRAYRATRTNEGAKDATINRELQIIRKAYKLAIESDPPVVTRMPKFGLPKERNARKVFIDPEAAGKLREAAFAEGLWARCFLEMAFTLGWRKGELEKLTVANIRLSENVIRIEESKNEDPREAPILDGVRPWLEALVRGRLPSDRLFPVKDFKYAWKRICIRAGILPSKKGFILHDIRRTSARSKRAAGVPESLIMELHGWKTSAMLRRYGIVSYDDKLRALKQEQKFLDELERQRQAKKQLEMFQRSEETEEQKGKVN